MSNRNPSAMLAGSLADFSKAAYQALTEIENQARQEVAYAQAETREARTERDKAMKDLHGAQLESQSWKQEVAASKAALAQAELTIAHQADSIATQLETIAQLRRELNQWKDQSRNWQEHFLRVEEERCAQSSRIDELIVEKLQYSRQSGTTTNTFVTPKPSKLVNQINSAPSSTSLKRPSSPLRTQPPAYRSNPESVTPEETCPNGLVSVLQGVNLINVGPPSGVPASRQHKPKSQGSQLQDRANDRDLPGTNETPPSGKKSRKSNGSHSIHPSGTATYPQHHPVASSSSAHSANPNNNIRSSTVIRRVQAVVHVKREEDEAEEVVPTTTTTTTTDACAVTSSAQEVPVAKKRKKGEPLEDNQVSTRRRLMNRREIVVMSEGENDEEGSDDGAYGEDKGMYNLRKPSRINYREEEDDELMMGAEVNHDELYGAYPVDHMKQQATAGSAKKKRRYSMR